MPSYSKKKYPNHNGLSNWEADVLSDGQKQYAATDAWACLNIYNLLQELKQTGRLGGSCSPTCSQGKERGH